MLSSTYAWRSSHVIRFTNESIGNPWFNFDVCTNVRLTDRSRSHCSCVTNGVYQSHTMNSASTHQSLYGRTTPCGPSTAAATQSEAVLHIFQEQACSDRQWKTLRTFREVAQRHPCAVCPVYRQLNPKNMLCNKKKQKTLNVKNMERLSWPHQFKSKINSHLDPIYTARKIESERAYRLFILQVRW